MLAPASRRLLNLPNRECEGGQSKDWRGAGGALGEVKYTRLSLATIRLLEESSS